jgi:hypothetical protein
MPGRSRTREAIPDLQRLLQDRVGPVDILQVVEVGLAASRCALISGRTQETEIYAR